jgi:hypothetical protein
MATLFGNLAGEKKGRPGVHPSVDDGFAAFARAGVLVAEPKQSLGSTYKASYCAHGLTDTRDLAVLLCEYADEAHASRGFEEAKTLFPGITTRQTLSRKTLLLVTTFQNEQHPAAASAAQKRVMEAFSAL